jgi:hypothetical protein
LFTSVHTQARLQSDGVTGKVDKWARASAKDAPSDQLRAAVRYSTRHND